MWSKIIIIELPNTHKRPALKVVLDMILDIMHDFCPKITFNRFQNLLRQCFIQSKFSLGFVPCIVINIETYNYYKKKWKKNKSKILSCILK